MSKLSDQAPPLYRPYLNGKYEVAPLLKAFGTPAAIVKKSDLREDESSVAIDSLVFQIDSDFPRYREEKIKALQEDPSKYFLKHKMTVEQEFCLQNFIIKRLLQDQPHIFKWQSVRGGGHQLLCHHTSDCLDFDSAGRFLKFHSHRSAELNSIAQDALLALSLQVQEDLAAWTQNEEENWMCWASILLPNHWAPEEKIGKNFAAVHFPVAESEAMLKRSQQIVRSMIHKGPFTRFAWGISTDTRLNHHPKAPPNWTQEDWTGRDFSPEAQELWVRSERQCLFGFADSELSLFTIRTYFEDVNTLLDDAEAKEALKKALKSMTKRSLEYKGLSKSLDSILEWIDAKRP